ncbi:hypothetical protein CSB20_06855, partial [bacterium DOLZORAL124_64_63]
MTTLAILPVHAASIFPLAFFGAALILGIAFFFILLKFFKTWLRAKLSQASVSMGSLVGMWLRKVPFSLIVDSR